MTMLNHNSTGSRFGINTCHIRSGYIDPAHIPHIALGYVPCSIEIGVKGKLTITAFNESQMSGSVQTMAGTAQLGCIPRVNGNNFDPFSHGFVLNEGLEGRNRRNRRIR